MEEPDDLFEDSDTEYSQLDVKVNEAENSEITPVKRQKTITASPRISKQLSKNGCSGGSNNQWHAIIVNFNLIQIKPKNFFLKIRF